jgi:hypothetical protein
MTVERMSLPRLTMTPVALGFELADRLIGGASSRDGQHGGGQAQERGGQGGGCGGGDGEVLHDRALFDAWWWLFVVL